MLLSCEDRSQKTGHASDRNVWMSVGGKRERDEVPAQTALREFYEETRGVFCYEEENLRQQLENANTPKFWFEQGKYVLYFCKIAFSEHVAQKFDERDEHPESTEHMGLEWIPLNLILDATRRRDPYLRFDGRGLRLYVFLLEMLTEVDRLYDLSRVVSRLE